MPELTHGDIGLQPERTGLAGRRTFLALIVCSCFFLRWVPHHGWLAVLPAGLCLAVAGLAWLRLRRRYAVQVQGLCAEPVATGVRVHLLLARCVTGRCRVELAAIVLW